jgi:hypothetical protein
MTTDTPDKPLDELVDDLLDGLHRQMANVARGGKGWGHPMVEPTYKVLHAACLLFRALYPPDVPIVDETFVQ